MKDNVSHIDNSAVISCTLLLGLNFRENYLNLFLSFVPEDAHFLPSKGIESRGVYSRRQLYAPKVGLVKTLRPNSKENNIPHPPSLGSPTKKV